LKQEDFEKNLKLGYFKKLWKREFRAIFGIFEEAR